MIRWKLLPLGTQENLPDYAVWHPKGLMVLQQEVVKQEDEYHADYPYPKKVMVRVWEDVPVVFEKTQGAMA